MLQIFEFASAFPEKPRHTFRADALRERTMVNPGNRILDDIARLATDAAGAAQGVRREVETVVKTQIERLLRDLDVVTREEFEAVREMALIAREENDKLAARLKALEEKLGKS